MSFDRSLSSIDNSGAAIIELWTDVNINDKQMYFNGWCSGNCLNVVFVVLIIEAFSLSKKLGFNNIFTNNQ